MLRNDCSDQHCLLVIVRNYEKNKGIIISSAGSSSSISSSSSRSSTWMGHTKNLNNNRIVSLKKRLVTEIYKAKRDFHERCFQVLSLIRSMNKVWYHCNNHEN